MKKVLLIALFLFFPFVVNAEEVKLDWENSFGKNGHEQFNYVISDGDDVVVVGTFSTEDIQGLTHYNNDDAIIAKYSKDGNVIWQTSWGGNDSDTFTSVESVDDGYIVLGETYSTDIDGVESLDFIKTPVMIKYDKNGNFKWVKSFGGREENVLSSLIITPNGDIVVVGTFRSLPEGLNNTYSSTAVIFKFDKNGDVEWQKSWGGNKEDNFSKILLTSNNEYIVVGETASTDLNMEINGDCDAIVVKYDEDGEVKWQNNYGTEFMDYSFSGLLTPDDKIIIFGITMINQMPFNLDSNIYKLDKDGNIEWHKTWVGSSTDIFNSGIILENGEFILSGFSNSYDIDGFERVGSTDFLFVKYDKDGNVIWNKGYGKDSYDESKLTVLSGDKEFISVGYITSVDENEIPDDNKYEGVILKYSFDYEYNILENENGIVDVESNGITRIIKPIPKTGYLIDSVVVKNRYGEEIEVLKQQDGTYIFDLYSDVTIDVIFKEELVNPKTGVIDYVLILLGIVAMSLMLYFTIIKYESKNNINLGM